MGVIQFLELMNVLLPHFGGVCVLDRDGHRGNASWMCGLHIVAVVALDIEAFNGTLVRKVAAMFVSVRWALKQGLTLGLGRR